MDQDKLFEQAVHVLRLNDRGRWTVPSGQLYPHQWLWDSCFIAIGLRHFDVARAKTELESLLRGQWRNGMLPTITFSFKALNFDQILWDTAHTKHSPQALATSGITQPPMLAEAVWLVGQKLDPAERKTWFEQMLPAIVRFHAWIYRERDPDHSGLAVLFHPYESGLDNSPPWVELLKQRGLPWWVKTIDRFHLNLFVERARRDLRYSKLRERMSDDEALGFIAGLHHLRSRGYDSRRIFKKPFLALQDLVFNSVLIQANRRLEQIAQTAGAELPKSLLDQMELSRAALSTLWDEPSRQFYPRNYLNGELVKESSIGSLLPLYAGSISHNRAEKLVGLLKKRSAFATNWPVPSVPVDSAYFSHFKYWQGPSWISMNWFIIHGLKHFGFTHEADLLRHRSLALVAKSGCSEYFNPTTGEGLGATNFSWTAALTIDLLRN